VYRAILSKSTLQISFSHNKTNVLSLAQQRQPYG